MSLGLTNAERRLPRSDQTLLVSVLEIRRRAPATPPFATNCAAWQRVTLTLPAFSAPRLSTPIERSPAGTSGRQVPRITGSAPSSLPLPALDGYDATGQTKALPGLAAISIIAVSSFAMKGDQEKERAAGCDDYATKPYGPVQLLRIIRGFLDEMP
jgi:CheY-like chemotaxis protein